MWWYILVGIVVMVVIIIDAVRVDVREWHKSLSPEERANYDSEKADATAQREKEREAVRRSQVQHDVHQLANARARQRLQARYDAEDALRDPGLRQAEHAYWYHKKNPGR
jgi:FtsZ-interacting cell division protein ZipA